MTWDDESLKITIIMLVLIPGLICGIVGSILNEVMGLLATFLYFMALSLWNTPW